MNPFSELFNLMAGRFKPKYSEPDPTPIQIPFDKQGRWWTRTHGIKCAQCGDTFFTWIPGGADWVPYQVDREPPIHFGWSSGLRGTCGSLICKFHEEQHQLARSPHYTDLVAIERNKRGGFMREL